MDWLNGYKTYIVAVVAIAYAVVQYWTGAVDADTLIKMVLAAAGLTFLRHSVAVAARK